MLANRVEGGVAAYQWAYTFFYLPHALFAAPIFSVLFTAMSEHVARNEEALLLGRLRDGLQMLGFVLIPVAAALGALAQPLAAATLRYGVMTPEGAELVGRVVVAFAIGLPVYSSFLVFTRGFYALGDTKTPTLVNAGTVALSSVAGIFLFHSLPDVWAVPGLALGHSIGFAAGALVLARLFYKRIPATSASNLGRSLLRTTVVSVLALAAMLAVAAVVDGTSRGAAFTELIAAGAAGGVVYLGVMVLLRAPELQQIRRILPGASSSVAR
jgi:putative peptidoglycan lipid II flippase